MDVECPVHNSRWALNRAIENVEKHFPVVGVLEDLDVSLKLMQKALPQYFQGIWDINGHKTRESMLGSVIFLLSFVNYVFIK